MNPAQLMLPLFFVLLILTTRRRKRRSVMAHRLMREQGSSTQNRSEETAKMFELAKRFAGKDCIIYTFNDAQITGTVKEVTEGAILVEDKNGTLEAINLACVTRLREHPTGKNGKKKSVVLD
jgi:hypothetical protein